MPSPTSVNESLRDLHRTGQLVSRYPEIRGLLTGLSGAELLTAGQLLSRIDPDEVLREHPAVPHLAVTGHGTLSQLVAPLTAELARHGLLAQTRLSDFDRYVFDLGDPDSELYA